VTCAEIAPLLADGALGLETDGDEPVLAPDEAARLEAHLQGCAPCREVQGNLARAHRRVAEAAATPWAPDAELRARTLLAVRETVAHDVPAREKKKPAPAEGPALDPARLDAIGRQIALACSYCRDRTGRDAAVFCASCLAPHHRECFEAHGRCSLPGCEETRTVRPQDAPVAAPRRRRWVPFVLAPLVLGGAVAALSAARLAEEEPASQPPPVAKAPPPPPEPTLDPWARTPVGPDTDFGPAIDVDVERRDLREVIAEVASRGAVNAVVDAGIEEQVSIALRAIPARQAVEVLARMGRCEVEELPGQVLVLHRPPAVSIQFTDANVRTVLQLLAAYAGKSIILAPDVTGTITVDVKEMRWDRALLTIARARNLHLTLSGADAVLVTTRRLDPARASTLPPAGHVVRDPRPDPARRPDPRVDVDLQDADLSEAMDELGQRYATNILVDPAVSERVTVRLRSLPLDQALGVIARLTRCTAEERPGGLWVLSQPPKVTLQAADCPLQSWFQLLGRVGGWSSAMDQIRGGISVDLKELRYRDAALLTAAAVGASALEDGDTLTLRGPTISGPDPFRAPKVATDDRLSTLTDEIVDRLRAARGARTHAERERLTGELETKQAELRTLLAPPAPQATPALAVPDAAEIEATLKSYEGTRESLEETLERLEFSAHRPQREFIEALDVMRDRADPRASDWHARLMALGQVGALIELQARLAQGNDFMGAMTTAAAGERWSDVHAGHQRVLALTARMRARPEDIFARYAEIFERRANALAAKARAYEAIGSMDLHLQAVLSGGESALAVINEQIVGVGDELRDEDGGAGAGAPRVVSITRSAVKLAVGEEIQFTLQLE
jgi:hypothetical protein